MTVWLSLAVVAWAAVCWRLGTVLAHALTTIFDRKLAIAERLAAVEERKVTLEELARRPAPKAPPMPADLRNRIASYDEDWAQEAEERTILMLYAEYDDWDQVRKNLRPLQSLTDPASLDAPFVEEFPR